MSEWDGIQGFDGWSAKLRALLQEADRAAKTGEEADRFSVSARLTEFVGESFPNDEKIRALDDVAGKAAMDYMWSNQLVAVWTAAGQDRKLRLHSLARPEGGQSENYYKPSQFISITSQSKHPKESAMFVDFITNNVDANKILLGERGVPIAPAVLDAIKPLSTPAQVEVIDYMGRIGKDISPLPPPDPAAQPRLVDNVYMPQLVDPVLLGRVKPEDAVPQFRQEANALLQSS